MNAAKRNAVRRGWPRGLYERKGWYYFREPSGKTWPIGRVTLAQAKAEAIAANQHLAGITPSLVERMTGSGQTVAQLLEKMPVAEKANTAKSLRSLDKIIRGGIGGIACSALTVKHCADLLETLQDKPRTMQAVRSRLMAVCRKGQSAGWMDSNPAEVTEAATVDVQRGRLTLESFHAIQDRKSVV